MVSGGSRLVLRFVLLVSTLVSPWGDGVFAPGSEQAPRPGEGQARPGETETLQALIGDARWPEAEAAARALMAQRAAADGEDSPAYAAAVDLLVDVLVRSGRWSDPKTKELAARAIDIQTRHLGPDAPDLATSLLLLGNIERLAGRNEQALVHQERALAIRQASFGADTLPVAEALWQLGWSYNNTDDPQKSVRLHEQALAIREKLLGPDDLLVADSLVGLGGVVRNAGDFERAAALHERALAIRRHRLRADHPDVALSVLSVADARHQVGDLAGALPLYEEAVALREKAASPDLPRLSEVLIDFGDLLTELGDFERARPYYERGLKIRVEGLGEGSWITGVGHESYGLFLEAAGDDAAARREFETAIATYDRELPPPHPLRARARQALGDLLRRQGDLDAARVVLQAAVDVWRLQPAPGHPSSGSAFMMLGAVQRDRGDVDAAGPLLEQAIQVFGAAFGTAHPRYGEALLERARLKWRQGNDAAALEDALRSEESLRASLRDTTRGLSEAEALRYQEIMVSGLDTAFSILARANAAPPDPAAGARVLEALARSRTLVLDEIAARRRSITRSTDPAVRRLDQALQDASRKYARLLVADPSPGYARLLQEAREGMERAERDLAAASRAFAAERTRQEIGFAAIGRELPPHAALVSYVAYRRSEPGAPGRGIPSYLAFALPAGASAPVVVPLGPAAGIDAAIEAWRREASSLPAGAAAEKSYRAAAGRLRETLWDPVAAHLGGAARVVVVPDGAIHALSFATLVGRDGRFLVETGPEFHYVSAERDLFGGSPPAAPGRGLLALGGPDFDAAPAKIASSQSNTPARSGPARAPAAPGSPATPLMRAAAGPPCADLAALKFLPLPGAAAEVHEVQGLWRGRGGDPGGHAGDSGGRAGDPGGAREPVRVLTGRDATEANLGRLASGKRVVHLATHAFFVPSQCDERPASGGAAEGRLQAGTPLRVCGLALSGANRRAGVPPGADDGLLTAEEISSLDLEGVEWVVLSGCQTGIGLARAGEGILGLRRSFQVAGARTLVLSLWPVSDNDTRSWMAELYRARSGGATTLEAANAASRRIVAARRKAGVTAHPFFWGAFVAAGDWR
ncbi:MAG TPA: CHAT domain-containing tetratricopeptide repeat protein [Candidatus Polarisedimenticolia bacterium]|nr:CHAT domain-containing tetratricopeptide repeat protein [Candidatus Polarisedimenticolia bacterium]